MHKLIWGRLRHGLLLITEANSKYSSAVESNKAQLLVDHNFPLRYLEVYLLPTVASFSHKTKGSRDIQQHRSQLKPDLREAACRT